MYFFLLLLRPALTLYRKRNFIRRVNQGLKVST
jgi:hypothetical protein